MVLGVNTMEGIALNRIYHIYLIYQATLLLFATHSSGLIVMKSICNSNWKYTIASYGDRLISQEEDSYEPNVDCNVTITTYPPYDRFSVDFDYIDLEYSDIRCIDYLNIYEGDVLNNQTIIEQVCREHVTYPTIDSSGLMTLRLVTDSTNQYSGFSLVFTAYHSASNITCSDSSFHCAHNDWCIQETLVCDGIDNCGDAADEQSCDTSSTSFAAITVILIIVILVLCIAVCGLFMWMHRYFYKKSTRSAGTPSNINLTDVVT